MWDTTLNASQDIYKRVSFSCKSNKRKWRENERAKWSVSSLVRWFWGYPRSIFCRTGKCEETLRKASQPSMTSIGTLSHALLLLLTISLLLRVRLTKERSVTLPSTGGCRLSSPPAPHIHPPQPRLPKVSLPFAPTRPYSAGWTTKHNKKFANYRSHKLDFGLSPSLPTIPRRRRGRERKKRVRNHIWPPHHLLLCHLMSPKLQYLHHKLLRLSLRKQVQFKVCLWGPHQE